MRAGDSYATSKLSSNAPMKFQSSRQGQNMTMLSNGVGGQKNFFNHNKFSFLAKVNNTAGRANALNSSSRLSAPKMTASKPVSMTTTIPNSQPHL
jgi:hypothetical protein